MGAGVEERRQRRPAGGLAAALLCVALGFGPGARACPRKCSGHGVCQGDDIRICHCFDGYTGQDCSLRACPAGNAFIDYATANNVAHAELTECSNNGACDKFTGECTCRPGFQGAACDRKICPSGKPYADAPATKLCFGHGTCMSMREAAEKIDYNELQTSTTYDLWDADMLYGCVCDEGWTGFDCSLQDCPKGDNVVTAGVDEIQSITCTCNTACSGTFTLNFRGQTATIPHDATAQLLEFLLEQLTTITDVTVTHTGGDYAVCEDDGATTAITFIAEKGDLPAMVLDDTNLASSGAAATASVAETQAGTREYVTCSNSGTCNHETGVCSCYSNALYANIKSSDGKSGQGKAGDCGYTGTPVTGCPSVTESIHGDGTGTCSGVGTCVSNACTCNAGYVGGACEEKSCTAGNAWFDEATGANTAHASAECANMGICDRKAGECKCEADFELFNNTGQAAGQISCNVMTCLTNATASADWPTCGGHGTCETISTFATNALDEQLNPGGYSYSTPWDANMVRGCMCTKSPSTTNLGSSSSDTFRGPYAFADTDWTGPECSTAACPYGDDPLTPGVNEIQTVSCQGTGGAFRLTFRGKLSDELRFDMTATEMKTALEALYSIGEVSVTFSDSTLCTSGTNTATIEFLTEFGDLPLFTASDFNTVTSGDVSIAESQKGTKEFLECANHGLCNIGIGQCMCMPGWVSSDGKGTFGHRGDCGYFEVYDTVNYDPAMLETG